MILKVFHIYHENLLILIFSLFSRTGYPVTTHGSDLIPEPKGFIAFGGEGVRLDGKKKRKESEGEVPTKMKQEYVRGIPDYDYEIGFLKFIRNSKPKNNGKSPEEDNDDDGFEAFKGQGKTLRQSRK